MPQSDTEERTLNDLIFCGFNRRVIAIDRYTGETVWVWKAPAGTGYVSLLLDFDRLIAAVNGYMYCLDPIYGQVVWENPLKGFGTGVTSLATVRGGTSSSTTIAEAEAAAQRAAAASAAS